MKTFAAELRPQTLGDVLGQKMIMPFLNKLVEHRELISLLFYGKPGIGKTSLAYALCNDLKVTYSYFNAATDNKAKLVEMIEINDYLIIDEIHRLNKDKQDLLLPAIENGKIRIVATTTENPYFVVNPAVRSRTHILELVEMIPEEIFESIKKLIKKEKLDIKISFDLIKSIAISANGDYRYALNIVSLLESLYSGEKITKKILKQIAPNSHFYSDRNGDGHYDLLSAFHKSLRGSDVNASLYYFGQLINSGDILGMERRMIMVAYEDIGMAAPNVALRVSMAIDNAKKVGFPEARIILANAVIDLSKALKSNSTYLAISNVEKELKRQIYPIPLHIQQGLYEDAKSNMKKLSPKIKTQGEKGSGYLYPHDFGGKVEQQYLPSAIKNKKFYTKNKNDKI